MPGTCEAKDITNHRNLIPQALRVQRSPESSHSGMVRMDNDNDSGSCRLNASQVPELLGFSTDRTLGLDITGIASFVREVKCLAWGKEQGGFKPRHRGLTQGERHGWWSLTLPGHPGLP